VAPGFVETAAGRVALIGLASGGSQLTPDTWAAADHAGVNFLELRKDGTLNPEQGRTDPECRPRSSAADAPCHRLPAQPLLG
jgi:hypothetical protein